MAWWKAGDEGESCSRQQRWKCGKVAKRAILESRPEVGLCHVLYMDYSTWALYQVNCIKPTCTIYFNMIWISWIGDGERERRHGYHSFGFMPMLQNLLLLRYVANNHYAEYVTKESLFLVIHSLMPSSESMVVDGCSNKGICYCS